MEEIAEDHRSFHPNTPRSARKVLSALCRSIQDGSDPLRLGRLFGARLSEMPTYIHKTTALLHGDPNLEGGRAVFLDDVCKGVMESIELKTLKHKVHVNNRVLQAAATLLNAVSKFHRSDSCFFLPSMWAYNDDLSPLYEIMRCSSAEVNTALPRVLGVQTTLQNVLERYDQVLGPINIGNHHWIGVKMSYNTEGRKVVYHPYDSGPYPVTVTTMPEEFLLAQTKHNKLNLQAGTRITIRYQGRTVDCALAVFAVWMAHLEIALKGEGNVEELMAQRYSGNEPYKMLRPTLLFLLFAFEDYCTAYLVGQTVTERIILMTIPGQGRNRDRNKGKRAQTIYNTEYFFDGRRLQTASSDTHDQHVALIAHTITSWHHKMREPPDVLVFNAASLPVPFTESLVHVSDGATLLGLSMASNAEPDTDDAFPTTDSPVHVSDGATLRGLSMATNAEPDTDDAFPTTDSSDSRPDSPVSRPDSSCSDVVNTAGNKREMSDLDAESDSKRLHLDLTNTSIGVLDETLVRRLNTDDLRKLRKNYESQTVVLANHFLNAGEESKHEGNHFLNAGEESKHKGNHFLNAGEESKHEGDEAWAYKRNSDHRCLLDYVIRQGNNLQLLSRRKQGNTDNEKSVTTVPIETTLGSIGSEPVAWDPDDVGLFADDTDDCLTINRLVPLELPKPNKEDTWTWDAAATDNYGVQTADDVEPSRCALLVADTQCPVCGTVLLNKTWAKSTPIWLPYIFSAAGFASKKKKEHKDKNSKKWIVSCRLQSRVLWTAPSPCLRSNPLHEWST